MGSPEDKLFRSAPLGRTGYLPKLLISNIEYLLKYPKYKNTYSFK